MTAPTEEQAKMLFRRHGRKRLISIMLMGRGISNGFLKKALEILELDFRG